MKFEMTLDNVLDIVGTACAAYVGYALTGGDPLPIAKDIVPWLAGAALGIFTWRQVRKNNA